MSPQEILNKYWGFKNFRELQEEIIVSILEGRDTLALMPTGGGKSICFQVPAIAKEGLCIVVSPLIALMKDQVMNLRQRNIKAMAVYSGMSAQEIDVALDNCVYGNVKFLYCSPERLATEIFKVRVAQMKVNLLAVDEAHCISQWGYDFRPPYLRIAEFRQIIPGMPVIAVTATATPEVVSDICDKLQFTNGKVFQKSFERKNLSYSVLFEENKPDRLVKMLDKVAGAAIVYVRNRRKTKEIAEFLQKQKISADFYHAGLEHHLRSHKQEAWTKGNTRVMVCTNAFGMGIDKADVRLVTHADVPDNLESYFQEAGRAGRDGKKSFSVILYQRSDLIGLQEKLDQGIPSLQKLRQVYQALANHFQLAVGAGENAPFDFEISSFCKKYHLKPLETYEAIKILEQEGYITLTDTVFLSSRILLTVDKETLYKFEVSNRKYELLLRTLLRSYAGIFEEFVAIREKDISHFTEIPITQIIEMLKELEKFQILRYEVQKDAPQIIFTRPRADTERMAFNFELLRMRRHALEKRLKTMKQYVKGTAQCRSQLLLQYFGEKNATRCGVCDVCLKRNKLNLTDLEFEKITSDVKHILQTEPLSIQDLLKRKESTQEKIVLHTIQWLLDNREIELNENNQLIFLL